MSDKIATDISFNNSFETFEVKTSPNTYKLYPNTPTNLSLQVNYRFISFGVNFAPDFIPGNGDEDLKGKTNSFGLGLALIFKHWFFETSYSKVKGYYLENSNDYIMRSPGDPFIQFPDLKYQGFSIASGYSTNSKFSIRSIRSQTERQLKSAGSFIPVFNFRYYKMDDQSDAPSTQLTNNFETSLGPGYSYTFVAKEKFYLSLGLLGSLGYLNTKLTTRQSSGNTITKQDNFILRWDAKAGIGYNGSKFYSGLYTNLSGTQYQQEYTTATNFETRVLYNVFVGIRFQSPGFIERSVTEIQKKFP